MASIIERNKRFIVVYNVVDLDGKKKQKWETFKTLAAAKKRRTEIEYRADIGRLSVPNCETVDDLMKEYVDYYGKDKWSPSSYRVVTGMITNYISPQIGSVKLTDVTARFLERYYAQLLQTPAVHPTCHGPLARKNHPFVTAYTVRKIHNVLRSAFNQALKWEVMEKNPCLYANVPKSENKKREIWDAKTLFHAIDMCDNDRLKICLNLAFACSLRLGELLGLTWDCVDISEDSLALGKASIYIKKELQRVSKEALAHLTRAEIIATFPETSENNKTVLVLKKPKTASSVRRIFLPRSVANMLVRWKEDQDEIKEALGPEYHDYNLVISGPYGTPTEGRRIEHALKQLIEANGLPPICFHSIRHTSITYKLKLNGGDIKAVQGDSGHAQAKMVTDQYSHILDEGRVENARKIEEAFYSGQAEAPKTAKQKTQTCTDDKESESAGIDPAMLAQILSNPEMVKLLKGLMSAMG